MEMVEAGHHVAVIDDLVVDLAKYHFHHPGGAFVLKQNIGRDISKYFHGAFSMENMGSNRVFNWYHSTNARRIVNSLAIARYIKELQFVLSTSFSKGVLTLLELARLSDLEAFTKTLITTT